MAIKKNLTLSDPKPFKLVITGEGEAIISLSPKEMAKMVTPCLGLLLEEFERNASDIPIKDVTKMVKLYMLKYTDQSTFRNDMLDDLYSKGSTHSHMGHLITLSLTVYQLILAGLSKPLEPYQGWEDDLEKLSETLCLPF